ncbi:MAG: hypothetical protein KDA65_09500, partial [Planctomycetaceae bacterium]|nr:hypothetical protein [Planctomycetaceae bacterium]
MTTPDLWAICFARQAAADFNTWKRLRNQKDPKYPECHVNQFLQMACEKICKSFLITHGSDPSTLQGSHAYIAKNLHTIIAQQISLKNENVSKHKSLLAHVKRLAGEVDRLSPSVDREQRPDNCEYPWAQGNNVYSPLDHH